MFNELKYSPSYLQLHHYNSQRCRTLTANTNIEYEWIIAQEVGTISALEFLSAKNIDIVLVSETHLT